MRYPIDDVSQICTAENIEITTQVLYVSVFEQKLYFYEKNILQSIYDISTGKLGVSQKKDSLKTPLGLHRIVEKIGDDAEEGTVFIFRKSTGKHYTEFTDWNQKGYITSRILRLKGLQLGYNLGGDVDTYDRCIYIHGIGNEQKIGKPCTQGCIGMKNRDIIDLYRVISVNSLVLIALK